MSMVAVVNIKITRVGFAPPSTSLLHGEVLTGPRRRSRRAVANPAHPVRIFISHASVDRVLADALVKMLILGGVPRAEITYTSERCTGVPTGELFGPYLKKRLRTAKLVIQLITPAFLASHFCLLELGGQWALGKKSFPLCVPPQTPAEVGATLGGVHVSPIDDGSALSELHDALEVALQISIPSSPWSSSVSDFHRELPSLTVVSRTSPKLKQESPLRRGRTTPTLQCSITELLTDPPFMVDESARPRLVLRAAARFTPGDLPDALPSAAIRLLADRIPVDFLERWKPFYGQARNGGVGDLRSARRDGQASSSTMAVAVREISKGTGEEPEVASRIALLLPGVMSGDMRFVVDLWLSERGPLPLDLALRSLLDAAILATDDLPRWFSGLLSGVPLGDRVTLELHAQEVVAAGRTVGQFPLTDVLDLSSLGEHEGRSPLVLSSASLLPEVSVEAITTAISQALAASAPNWGYFDAPDDLVVRTLAAEV